MRWKGSVINMPTIATYTYTYTSGVGTPGHKCVYGANSVLPAPMTGTDATGTDYTSMAADDSSSFRNDGAYAYKIHRFLTPTTTSVSNIKGTCISFSEDYFDSQDWDYATTYLLIYNVSSSSWEILSSHSNHDFTEISGDITSNFLDYIDNNYYYLATWTDAPGFEDYTGRLWDDYVALTVTVSKRMKSHYSSAPQIINR